MTRQVLGHGTDFVEQKLESSICGDFVSGFESSMRHFLKGEKSNNLCLVMKWLKLVCLHGAEKCATALIEKGIGMNLDLNAVLEDGLPPLHIAARRLSYGLTKVFLLYGAKPDLPSYDANAKLPLELALEALSCNQYVRDWSAEKSFYKLFYIFCFEELREPLETVKLLTLKTEQVEMICMRCVEAGEVVKLAALLVVAWDRLIGPYLNEGIEGCPIGQCILKEMGSVADQEMRLSASGSTSNLDLLLERKTKLECAWLMLKIFETSHDGLEFSRRFTAYQVVEPHEIPFCVFSRLSRENSITLRPEDVYSDDVNCLMPGLDSKGKAWLDQALQRQMHAGSSASTKCKKHGARTVSSSRPFHTSTSLSSSFSNDMKGLVTTTAKVVKPSFLEFLPPAGICARLLSAVRTLK